MIALSLVPVTLREAQAFVEHHRHHDAPRGCLFCVGVADEARVVAVAIVGRPNARMIQNGFTAEVTRLCVDEAYVLEVTEAWCAGTAYAAREQGRTGLDHAAHVLAALDRCPHRHAASLLYGASWRACRAIGYRKLVTYTLPEEGGASLRASGWKLIGEAGGHLEPGRSAPRRHAPAPNEAALGGY
jgi:hypothetical protein